MLDLVDTADRFGLSLPFDPTSMHDFIKAGRAAVDATNSLLERSSTSRVIGAPEAEVEWLVPIEPPLNFICAGRNFGAHEKESRALWKREGVELEPAEIPTGFVKLATALTGHRSQVEIPPGVVELDYEIEVAAVIGKPTLNLEKERSLDWVFGYTVFNDLCDRRLQRREMRNQLLVAAKNYPGFGPLGPWIVTVDEVPSPNAMTMELRVNGELRQSASLAEMTYSFAELLAFWAPLGLQPGDLIASGTPAGVAVGHSDPTAWYLKSGDIIEATVSPLGTLLTTIK